MGMVLIQSCILVSKLNKIKTMLLRYASYLNSIQNPTKQDLLQNVVLCPLIFIFLLIFMETLLCMQISYFRFLTMLSSV